MRSLIGDIKTRQMDLIIAYDMSRISRDIMDMMSLLKMLTSMEYLSSAFMIILPSRLQVSDS